MSRNSNRPPRVVVPLSRLEQRLSEQLRFVSRSCEEFDRGDRAEFRRIAVALRILLHDRPPQSHGLLRQLGLRQTQMMSFAMPLDPSNFLSEFSLSQMKMEFGPGGVSSTFEPILDGGPFAPRLMHITDWLAEPVLRDHSRVEFTRWDFIRSVANQDGGAHVDPEIDEAYHRLTNENAVGWIVSDSNGIAPIEHVEKAYIRHMGFELLVSISPVWNSYLGAQPCPCNSGQQAVHCCGKDKDLWKS